MPAGVNSRQAGELRDLIAPRDVELDALPPNKGMQLAIRSATLFKFAKAAPLLLVAHPRC